MSDVGRVEWGVPLRLGRFLAVPPWSRCVSSLPSTPSCLATAARAVCSSVRLYSSQPWFRGILPSLLQRGRLKHPGEREGKGGRGWGEEGGRSRPATETSGGGAGRVFWFTGVNRKIASTIPDAVASLFLSCPGPRYPAEGVRFPTVTPLPARGRSTYTAICEGLCFHHGCANPLAAGGPAATSRDSTPSALLSALFSTRPCRGKRWLVGTWRRRQWLVEGFLRGEGGGGGGWGARGGCQGPGPFIRGDPPASRAGSGADLLFCQSCCPWPAVPLLFPGQAPHQLCLGQERQSPAALTHRHVSGE